MAIFNVIRAGRNRNGYMERLINGMYADDRAIYKRGNGANDMSSQMIIDSFKSVRNVYYKMNMIEVHYLEVVFEKSIGKLNVCAIAESFGKYLFRGGFQSFITVIETDIHYVMTVVINSVSYVDGRMFWDNNAVCYEMYLYLCGIIPRGINLQIADNTLFNQGGNNYVYGMYRC